jgi:hypothetical protein
MYPCEATDAKLLTISLFSQLYFPVFAKNTGWVSRFGLCESFRRNVGIMAAQYLWNRRRYQAKTEGITFY